MATTTYINNRPISYYWNQLRDLPSEKKVQLITLLRSSLSEHNKPGSSFPKIPYGMKPSAEAMALSLGKPAVPFDFDKETEEMWEELANFNDGIYGLALRF